MESSKNVEKTTETVQNNNNSADKNNEKDDEKNNELREIFGGTDSRGSGDDDKNDEAKKSKSENKNLAIVDTGGQHHFSAPNDKNSALEAQEISNKLEEITTGDTRFSEPASHPTSQQSADSSTAKGSRVLPVVLVALFENNLFQ